MNEAFASIVGWTPKDLIGQHVDVIIPEEDRSRNADRRARRISGEITETRGDVDFLHKDGFRVPVEQTAQLTIWKGAPAIQAFVVDLTERKRSEQELIVAREAAEEANRAKSRFLANFSHELRTPLNAVIGFSDIMRQKIYGPLGDPKYEEYVGDIHESGQHLLMLVSDILDLSRIEAGRFETFSDDFDGVEVTGECIRLVAGRANSKGVFVRSYLPKTSVTVHADEKQFRQILLNILSNAVKFTRPETVVTVSMSDDDGKFVSIRIEDQGNGISDEDMSRIFDPFVRGGDAITRTEEGTGLGLAITSRLVELNGGKMTFDTEINVGTCVTLQFPTKQD